MDHMNDFKSCAKSSRCYEQLKSVDDMNDSRSFAENFLDARNNSMLWMT